MFLDYLQVYFPLIAFAFILIAPIEKGLINKISLFFSLGFVVINLIVVLYSQGNLNEFWNFLVVMNQEKSFDFFLYRTDLSNLFLVVCSLINLLMVIASADLDLKNSKFIHAVNFLILWDLLIFFYSDSLVLFISALEISGVLFLLLAVAINEIEGIKKYLSFWIVSTFFMFIGLSILASVLGSAKGVYDVTISSMPSLIDELGFFPAKNYALIFIVLSLVIKIGVFPFHGWILKLLELKNPFISASILFYLPHMLFNLMVRFFSDVSYSQDLLNSIFIILSTSSIILLCCYLLKTKRAISDLGFLSIISNGVVTVYSMNTSFDSIKYAYYILLSFNLFLLIIFLGLLEHKKIVNKLTKVSSFLKKYIVLAGLLFPFSMLFVSFTMLLSKFSSMESPFAFLILGTLIFSIIFYTLKNYSNFLSIRVSSVNTWIPFVLLVIVILVLGLNPSLIVGNI